jgi:hypothetical protein
MAATKKSSKAIEGARAYERFLPEARTMTRVLPLRTDASIAKKRVLKSVETVMRYEIRIRRDLPNVDVKELRSLPALASAVVYAAGEAARASGSKQDLKPLLSRARALRARLLAAAQRLVTAGLLDRAVVAKTLAGFGPLDSARDCVALATLLGKHAAAVQAKTSVTGATIEEAEKVGEDLIERLKPSRTRTTHAAAVAARDKLWTLLLRRYDTLWRVGAFVLGPEVNDKIVPTLRAKAQRL